MTLLPNNDIEAGSRVVATDNDRIITVTPPIPRDLSIMKSNKSRPDKPRTEVIAENITDLPAVDIVIAIAVSVSCFANSSRNLFTTRRE